MEAFVPMVPPSELTIGKRLLRLLAARRWSLRKLSAESGVSPSQLSLFTRDIIRYPQVSTVAMICDALGVSSDVLMGTHGKATALDAAAAARLHQRAGGGRAHPPDLRAYEGVTAVPVVRLLGGGRFEETGETCAIALAHLDERARLKVTIIDGGGMAPDITIDSRVLFDPDDREAGETPRAFVVLYRYATIAAWRGILDGVFACWVNEGVRLDTDLCDVAGLIVYSMKPPPTKVGGGTDG